MIVEEISENDSASVSAMSATAVISLSPTCRCFTSVGDRFPEILLTQHTQFTLCIYCEPAIGNSSTIIHVACISAWALCPIYGENLC